MIDFLYGSVVALETGDPRVLIVEVTGTVLSLEITDATEVRGVLTEATMVNGHGRRVNGGTAAEYIEVVCPKPT